MSREWTSQNRSFVTSTRAPDKTLENSREMFWQQRRRPILIPRAKKIIATVASVVVVLFAFDRTSTVWDDVGKYTNSCARSSSSQIAAQLFDDKYIQNCNSSCAGAGLWKSNVPRPCFLVSADKRLSFFCLSQFTQLKSWCFQPLPTSFVELHNVIIHEFWLRSRTSGKLTLK